MSVSDNDKSEFAAPMCMLMKNTDSPSQLQNMSTSMLLHVDADVRSKMKDLKHLALNQATVERASLTGKALK